MIGNEATGGKAGAPTKKESKLTEKGMQTKNTNANTNRAK
jgi:hypothetical protein